MKKTPLLLSAILSLCIAVACFAEDAKQPFPTKHGFTFHLPTDWKPIPPDVLDAYTREIARLAPQAEKQVYDYGFQLSAARKWFTYPYILVQVKRSGRIPEDQLRTLSKLGEAMDSSFAKAGKSISSFATNGKIGETVLDPSTHTLWTRMSIDVKGVGTINGLIGTVLTETGFIQISCYAKEQDFRGYSPIFEDTIRNIILSDDLKYRDSTIDLDHKKTFNNINATTIILSLIFTWSIGLFPPLLIRYVIIKRPVNKWPAIGICALLLLSNLLFFIFMGSRSKTHFALTLIAFISYFILRKKY